MKLHQATALLLVPLVAAAADEKIELRLNQPFPNLVLPLLANGRPASISNFRGRKLILHIFASW